MIKKIKKWFFLYGLFIPPTLMTVFWIISTVVVTICMIKQDYLFAAAMGGTQIIGTGGVFLLQYIWKSSHKSYRESKECLKQIAAFETRRKVVLSANLKGNPRNN